LILKTGSSVPPLVVLSQLPDLPEVVFKLFDGVPAVTAVDWAGVATKLQGEDLGADLRVKVAQATVKDYVVLKVEGNSLLTILFQWPCLIVYL
jgi:hypothetical protein